MRDNGGEREGGNDDVVGEEARCGFGGEGEGEREEEEVVIFRVFFWILLK